MGDTRRGAGDGVSACVRTYIGAHGLSLEEVLVVVAVGDVVALLVPVLDFVAVAEAVRDAAALSVAVAVELEVAVRVASVVVPDKSAKKAGVGAKCWR